MGEGGMRFASAGAIQHGERLVNSNNEGQEECSNG